MSYAIDPNALASALPAGIEYPANDSPAGKAWKARWHAPDIARFQAEWLTESGYRLIYIGDDSDAAQQVEDIEASVREANKAAASQPFAATGHDKTRQ
jgi:hypothetical protein